jgi:hypothetical protein
MRKAPVLLVLALLVPLAACTSDSGGSPEAFCDLFISLEGVDTPTDEQLDALVSDAPSDIKGDVETLVGTLDEFAGIEEEDPDDFAAAFELLEDPDFVEAAENVEAYAVDECGIEPSDTGSSEDFESIGSVIDE